MRILYIQPGSGGSFYCQNCLRDMALAAALRRRGHDTVMMPLYLPATADADAPSRAPLFYGAVSLYLRHRCAWLRRLPRAWFAPLDAWPVLRLAARFAGSTQAAGLEDLTLSMLRGPAGRQAEELRAVADWIAALPADEKPEAVILSNALLAGMAAALKNAAGCPVFCWLQDEHVWTDAMPPAARAATLDAMRQQAASIDGFFAVSRHYAAHMAELIALPLEKIRVVYPGIDAASYARADVTREPAVIGFLSRLAPAEGFDRFVDAFIWLRRDPRFKNVRLSATGGLCADKRFLKAQLAKLERAGLAADARIDPARFAADRAGFLSELTLLCVPGSDKPEAFGYYALEAMAAGVPLVLPAHGAFPEIAAAAGCVTLAPDTRPATLAAVWGELLNDRPRLLALSDAARAAAETRFSQDTAAANLEAALLDLRG